MSLTCQQPSASEAKRKKLKLGLNWKFIRKNFTKGRRLVTRPSSLCSRTCCPSYGTGKPLSRRLTALRTPSLTSNTKACARTAASPQSKTRFWASSISAHCSSFNQRPAFLSSRLSCRSRPPQPFKTITTLSVACSDAAEMKSTQSIQTSATKGPALWPARCLR